MKFLPPDDDVDVYETVFTKDILRRMTVSVNLSSVVDRIEDPLVIALDGRWGTGKSFFLKRWVGAHRKQNDGKALTVYFDAFESDYLSDPLPALVSALSARAPRSKSDKLDSIKKSAIKLIKPITRIGLSLATYGATEALSGIGDAAAEAMGDEAKGAAENFWRREEGRQEAMKEFKSSLTDLTKGDEGDIDPVVIVVDELDRCRPDYALEILEVIKHFFSVPHVHFVLGVNLKALENSVKARYGNGIDATAYLLKFISFSISLPEHIGDNNRTPAVIEYAKHAAKAMGINGEINSDIMRQLEMVLPGNNVSIRDVGKIMSLVSILPKESRGSNVYSGWRLVTVTMVIAKVISPRFYETLLNSSATRDSLLSYFGVSEQDLSERLGDGNRNVNYNHVAFIVISVWHYIISNGESSRADPSAYPVGKLFDQFGDVSSPKNIPKRVNDDWLSQIDVGSI